MGDIVLHMCTNFNGHLCYIVICTFSNILPEAICCCLQTCFVDVMLLLMDCVCILTFIVVTLLVASCIHKWPSIIMYGLRLFFNVKLKVKG